MSAKRKVERKKYVIVDHAGQLHRVHYSSKKSAVSQAKWFDFHHPWRVARATIIYTLELKP